MVEQKIEVLSTLSRWNLIKMVDIFTWDMVQCFFYTNIWIAMIFVFGIAIIFVEHVPSRAIDKSVLVQVMAMAWRLTGDK